MLRRLDHSFLRGALMFFWQRNVTRLPGSGTDRRVRHLLLAAAVVVVFSLATLAIPCVWARDATAPKRPNIVVILRSWKLVSRHGQPWELYDLQADRVELQDLAASHPERVEELSRKYEEYARRCLVEPWPVKRP